MSAPSLAGQTVEQLGGRRSVLARQRADHEELDRLLHELDGATGTEQLRVLRAVDRLVFTHAFAEESVLWPVIRRVLPDGEALTLEIEVEHQQVNELASTLERTPLDDPTRSELLARLVAVLEADVREEEDELFPRLQQAVDVGTLRRMGWAWEVVRRVSPTRPHPTVSRRPPGNTLSAAPLSVLDRTRDHVDALVQRAPSSAVAGVGRSASAALARAAGWVERLPVVRTGDRPPTSR